ncbi:Sen2p [Sugiyamaella lignohabitans]|uniref:tRNA-splicing endonuclease subunit Sen2 n=1 Tax=Sugiyamaella lignohabitans TaxID=796027 RepID=A0A167C3K9_9ASCO|nr:Sen2p [Sugiyamaella lignohabitans]ANB11175.1 Sen2p [Sugiyamaella lignohabitans]
MKKSLNQLYGSPLPLVVRPLPPIIPHNPLSWIFWLWEYWFPEPEYNLYDGILHALVLPSETTFYVRIDNGSDINSLWSMGFFGKGTLSRSEPSWYTRTARRLGLQGGEQMTSEEVTAARREERKKFKMMRAQAEAEELARRKKLDEMKEVWAGQDSDSVSTLVDEESKLTSTGVASEAGDSKHELTRTLEESQPAQAAAVLVESSASPEVSGNHATVIRFEDQSIIDSNNKLIQQEYLQLMPQEAFFLSYGLGVLRITDHVTGKPLTSEELLTRFVSANPRFLSQYAVYHHYRSLGWCVRSGVKFGSELLLYKRGPPFSHAEFCIRILTSPGDEQHDWWWNTSIGRVVGGVKKGLVFCYVQGNDTENTAKILDASEGYSIKDILGSYQIREVVYRRWIATRNRD